LDVRWRWLLAFFVVTLLYPVFAFSLDLGMGWTLYEV
jgi:hypothetical protein